jgi:hypothetical protein
MNRVLHTVLPLLLCISAVNLPAQSLSLNGQAIGWSTVNPTEPFHLQSGLRYIPKVEFSLPAGSLTIAGDQSLTFIGTTVSYPLGLIHHLSAIIFIDISNNDLYRFVNWSATFDRWTFYTMAFWNPKNYQLYNFQQEATLFGGTGFQLMAVFNH